MRKSVLYRLFLSAACGLAFVGNLGCTGKGWAGGPAKRD